MRKNAGNLMAVFLGILLVVVIVFPLIIQLLQNESKQSVHRQKSTVAFQLAEAAVAKGYAKLTETRKNYIDGVAGIPLTDYNDDREYEDIPGGKYKISITSGSSPGTVRVIGKGKDSSSFEVRTIVAEYSGSDPEAPAAIFDTGENTACFNFKVEWGSVKSYADFAYLKNVVYPRIFSAGNILFRDEDPTPPNTDNIHYWAYQSDMGVPPVPDLAYYKQKAMNSIVPSSSTTGEIRLVDGSPVVRNPPNSGYFQSSLNPGKHTYFDKFAGLPEGMGNLYEFRSSTSVIFLDATGFASRFFINRVFLEVEALVIPYGGITIVGSAVPYHIYSATIPETAPFHYQSTAPILVGAPTGQAEWNSNYQAIFSQPNHCCYDITNLQLHGYYYGRPGSSSKFNMLGVAQFTTTGSMSGNQIFYDPSVLENVSWANVPMHRISWKEISRSW